LTDENTIKHKSAVSFCILLEFKGSEPPGIGIYADECEWRSIGTPRGNFSRGWMVISNQKPSTTRGFLTKRLCPAISFVSGTIVQNHGRARFHRIDIYFPAEKARDLDLRNLARRTKKLLTSVEQQILNGSSIGDR